MASETWGRALADAARRWPDRTAMVDSVHRLSFARLHAVVLDRARLLADAGVRPGDRVVVHLDNGVDLATLVLAAWRIGAVAVPVVTLFRAHELTTVVRETRPAVVVAAVSRGGRRPVAEVDAALSRNAHRPLHRYCVGGEHPGWQRLPAPATEGAGPRAPIPPPPVAAGSDVVVLFTSGTTSEPKGVRHGSSALLEGAETYRRSARLTDADAVLVPAPMAHVGGLICGTMLAPLTGASAVLVPRWEVGSAVAVMAAQGVTFVAAAVPVLSDLVDHYEHHGGGHRPVMFHTGAAPTSPELIERADRCGIVAWRSWGMTECPNATVSGRDASLADRARTDGLIEPGVEVEAVDESLQRVPDGIVGQLRVRGVKLMRGYTAPAFADSIDLDGWFLTGDLGTVRSDGRVTITGRSKDVINRGGETFSAQEIETVIRGHMTIADVAVVGRPDARLGEQVVAFVVLTGGAGFPGHEALIAHLTDSGLARQKFPVAWEVVDELPRTATGKVRKRELVRVATDAAAGQDGSAVTSTDITI